MAYGPLTSAEEFTGIGGFTLGFQRAGIKTIFMGEILEQRRRLLAHHFPGIRIGGDINDTPASDIGRPDILCGGFPCDGTSIGQVKRVGLVDHRSSEFFSFMHLVQEYQRLIDALGPRWVVIENPDGLLKSPGKCNKKSPCCVDDCTPSRPCKIDHTGQDLATIFDHLVDRGYGVAGRVVDAQFLGSPQRRKRLILVGHRGGDPRPALQVLADAGASGAVPATSRVRPGPRGGPVAVQVGRNGRSKVFLWRKRANPRASLAEGGYETWEANPEFSNTLTGFDWGDALRQKMQIAQDGRLRTWTVREWERLGNFPDDWTVPMIDPSWSDVMADRERADAIGDSMHPGMAEWLGRRIVAVDAALPQLQPVP